MPVVKLPEIDTSNPLLVEEWDTPRQTPPFSRIETKHYAPAFETAIAVVRAEIEAIVNNPAKPTFRNTIVPLERQGVLLNRIRAFSSTCLRPTRRRRCSRSPSTCSPR